MDSRSRKPYPTDLTDERCIRLRPPFAQALPIHLSGGSGGPQASNAPTGLFFPAGERNTA
jgi:hypothetical protein